MHQIKKNGPHSGHIISGIFLLFAFSASPAMAAPCEPEYEGTFDEMYEGEGENESTCEQPPIMACPPSPAEECRPRFRNATLKVEQEAGNPDANRFQFMTEPRRVPRGHFGEPTQDTRNVTCVYNTDGMPILELIVDPATLSEKGAPLWESQYKSSKTKHYYDNDADDDPYGVHQIEQEDGSDGNIEIKAKGMNLPLDVTKFTDGFTVQHFSDGNCSQAIFPPRSVDINHRKMKVDGRIGN